MWLASFFLLFWGLAFGYLSKRIHNWNVYENLIKLEDDEKYTRWLKAENLAYQIGWCSTTTGGAILLLLISSSIWVLL